MKRESWRWELNSTLEALNKIVADIILFLHVFQENKTWHFNWIASLGDNLHEIWKLIFWEKQKKN